MTIQMTRGKSVYTYQIDPSNPLIIERKLNRHNARWQAWRMLETAEHARAALLTLDRPDPSPGAAAQAGVTR